MEPLWTEVTATPDFWFCPFLFVETVRPEIIHIRVGLSTDYYHLVLHDCWCMVSSSLWYQLIFLELYLFDRNFPTNFRLHFKVFLINKKIGFTLLIDEFAKIWNPPLPWFLVASQIKIPHVSLGFLMLFNHLWELNAKDIVKSFLLSLSPSENIYALKVILIRKRLTSYAACKKQMCGWTCRGASVHQP